MENEIVEQAKDLVMPSNDEMDAPKVNRKHGKRKVVLPNGEISYGFLKDGITPRKAPGRKRK